MERYESPVERAIREAQERGDFDNLPGAGKPLRNLGNPETEDPNWWVKGLLERENLDLTAAMPPALALRKEAETYPQSLLDLRTEESVRAVLEDYNRRVRQDRLRPALGPLPPLIARTVDVDDLVQWRELRDASVSAAAGLRGIPRRATRAGPQGPAARRPSGQATIYPRHGWSSRTAVRHPDAGVALPTASAGGAQSVVDSGDSTLCWEGSWSCLTIPTGHVMPLGPWLQ